MQSVIPSKRFVSDCTVVGRLSARDSLVLGERVSFAWKESAGSFPCGREFRGQYVGALPTIELIGEIQFHAV